MIVIEGSLEVHWWGSSSKIKNLFFKFGGLGEISKYGHLGAQNKRIGII